MFRSDANQKDIYYLLQNKIYFLPISLFCIIKCETIICKLFNVIIMTDICIILYSISSIRHVRIKTNHISERGEVLHCGVVDLPTDPLTEEASPQTEEKWDTQLGAPPITPGEEVVDPTVAISLPTTNLNPGHVMPTNLRPGHVTRRVVGHLRPIEDNLAASSLRQEAGHRLLREISGSEDWVTKKRYLTI